MVQSKVKYDDRIAHLLLELRTGDDAERKLFRAIEKAFLQLELNSQSGVQIQRGRIPINFRHFPNLWKLNLSSGWRLIYWITSKDDSTITVVVEWLSHDKYERRFNY